MAHWQLDQREEARQWFDRSIAWIEKNHAHIKTARHWEAELCCFRAEAEGLMGIERTQD
jgi:hypothetical protein